MIQVHTTQIRLMTIIVIIAGYLLIQWRKGWHITGCFFKMKLLFRKGICKPSRSDERQRHISGCLFVRHWKDIIRCFFIMKLFQKARHIPSRLDTRRDVSLDACLNDVGAIFILLDASL